MLITNIFSFPHYVFKGLFPSGHQKLSVYGKGSNVYKESKASSFVFQSVTINLVVMAQDQGTPPLNSTVSVILTIVSDSEDPPRFLPGNYSVSVSESLGVGGTITTIMAKSQNGLEFVLVPLSNIFRTQKVIPDEIIVGSQINVTQMARLKTEASLDYETTQSYTLTVRATVSIILYCYFLPASLPKERISYWTKLKASAHEIKVPIAAS